MKFCKWCGKELENEKDPCPNCGVEQRRKTNYKPIIVVGVFIVAVIVLMFISNANSGPRKAVDGSLSKDGEVIMTGDGSLEIINKSLIRDGMFLYIVGTVKNHSEKPYSRVEITFNLYDRAKNQTGTAMDAIQNLEAKGTWKYKAMVTVQDSDLADYKAMRLAGWD